MTILETQGLKFSYPDGTKAIKGLDIKLMKGKKIAFVGQNGSGKSTLFLLLNGTLKPTEGNILFDGKEVQYDSKSLKEIRQKVGIIFQNSDDQIFAPTVYQDIAFGPSNLGHSNKIVEAKVNEMLGYFGIEELKDRPPHHLSGGQKKRVAIAGVVAMEPEVVILDEPLANLDPVGADELMDILNELNHMGTTLIISTHDVDLAYKWADYVFFLVKGEIIGEGKPSEVFRDHELLRKSHLRLPVTFDIYREIERRNLAHSQRNPRTVPDIVNALKPPDLMWVDVPPETQEGDELNLGILYGDYALESPYEAVNGKVLHIHPEGKAIVELTRHGFKAGGITIYDMDGFDSKAFDEFIQNDGIDVIGAMGKRSKTLAEQNSIAVDISSGVIDRAILMALCGKRCMILTNGGMIPHSLNRINEYVDRSGIAISVSVANPQ
ncbi:cobalt/nickel transport system ATP-binding protein [Methanohalophilus levihalophilus]|uniref:energy-coupling factor ABC transporter ATP-binding protein n=1 Tax=Methanohalophilus levihalophilus TaxID=1431282 RepID=UPI001AE9CACD|nr:ATP-binding cassette domain-containing protein [Methanohalophilus levihalophilus]MBP2029887.1 cobalt/nickel transport system ATP-binding protein [Methanohalophilus levihalophilus]